jgi:hypothetical protein
LFIFPREKLTGLDFGRGALEVLPKEEGSGGKTQIGGRDVRRNQGKSGTNPAGNF